MILNPASRKKRIFAASVDILIAVVVYFFIVVMFGNKQEDASGHAKFVLSGLPAFFLFFGTWSYFVIPEIILGQTLGKSLFDIKVVSLSGDDINIQQSIMRHLCDLIDFAPFAFIVFIIVTNNNDKKQRVGDMLAKTMVIEELTSRYKEETIK